MGIAGCLAGEAKEREKKNMFEDKRLLRLRNSQRSEVVNSESARATPK
jgi:hypothetical protein